jgi:hypothetical protein
MSQTIDRDLFEERHRTAGNAWGKEHPPCDSAAEAAVLNMLLIFPDRMATVDLRGRLHFREHQTIHQAMSRVWMRQGLIESGPWTLAIFRELHDMLNGRHAGPCDRDCLAGLHWDVVCRGQTARLRDLDYWLERLDRCVEARRLIEAAQFQAACAWRGDLEEARWAAAAVTESYSPPVVRATAAQPADRRRVDVNVSDLDM